MKLLPLCTLGVIILGSLPFTILKAEDVLPDLQNVATPKPEPSSPADWDIFIPPVTSNTPSANAPAIAEWTHTGGPDDTLILTGDKLSSFAGVAEGRDTQFIFYGQITQPGGVQSTGLIQRLDGLKAGVVLPSSLPPFSMYFLWPGNSDGYGYPVAINCTEAWWLNPNDHVSRGDTVSVFGRNLAHSGGTIASWVYLKSADTPGSGEWAAVTSVNPYRIQFTVPDGLANGTYEVWTHNGHGAHYGWSGPLTLTVGDSYRWNGTTFNVKTYGAKGDGVTDDTDAIARAYAAALNYRDGSGSAATLHPTLYFPTGVYMMHSGISLKHDVRLLGDGKDQTILRCSANFKHTSEQGLIYGESSPEHDIEVSNLMLDANGCFTETSFPYDYLFNCTFTRQWKDIRLSNLSIQIANSENRVNAMSLGEMSRIVITGCEVVGGNINLLNANHVVIDKCFFRFVNDVFTAVNAQAVTSVSVTNCNCANNDITSQTGQGLGRFIILGGYLGSQRNIYIGDNHTSNCAPRPEANDYNSGEQILSEGNGVRYEGMPAAATQSTVTFSNLAVDSSLRPSQTAVIVKGKGLGQVRPIANINYASNAITVTPVWNVVPDSTSVVQIARTTDRCVIYHNTLDGKSDYATRFNNSNSCAILSYGGCNEWIADSNTITHMRYAICVMGLAQYPPEPVTTTEPCLFNYYANNSVQECYRGCFCYADTATGIDGLPLPRLGFLGNIFRRNQWSNISSCGICFDGATTGIPVDMSLFDHNIFINLPQGINFFSHGHVAHAVDTMLYKNAFTRGTATLEGSCGAYFISTTVAPMLQGNIWSEFQIPYSGISAGAILEIPIRTAALRSELEGTTTSVVTSILNSGTATMNWNASSDSVWLTLSSYSGSVPDERSVSPLIVNCNASGLQEGTYRGIINVSAGDQTKKIMISFTVGSAVMPPKQAKIATSIILPPFP